MGEESPFIFLNGTESKISIHKTVTIYQAKEFHQFLMSIPLSAKPLAIEIDEHCDLDTAILQLLLAFIRERAKSQPIHWQVPSSVLLENLRFMGFTKYCTSGTGL